MTMLSNVVTKTLEINNDKIIKDDGRVNETVKNLLKSKKSKNNKAKNLTCIRGIGKFVFLTPNIRKVFRYLK